MADGRLRLEASANFSRLNTAFEKSKQKVASLEDRLSRLEQGHDRMGKKSQSAFGIMARYAQNVITSYVGIHAAIATVNHAIQEEIELRRRAADANKSLQEERILLMGQTASFSPEQRAEFESRVLAAGRQAGITESQALSAGRRALTATSDSDPNLRIDKAAGILEKMALALGPRLAAAEGLPGAVLDLQRTLGGSQEQAIGLLKTALDNSRLEDDAEAPNFIRTIAGAAAIQTGVQDKETLAEQTLALFSAFQAVTGDVIGANTSTAIVNFIAALQREQGDRTLTPDQLIDALQDEEGIKFIGKSFSKPVQEDLIRSGSEISRIYRDNLKAVSKDHEQVYRESVRLVSGVDDPELMAFRASERAKAEAERLLRETRGVDAQAVGVVKSLAPVARPPLSVEGVRRMVSVGVNNAVGDVDSSLGLSRTFLAEKLSRNLLSPITDYVNFGFGPGFGRTARVAAARRRFSDEELLTLGDDSDPTLVAARAQLRELLAIQKAQMAEESAARKSDNAKLVDTVGKAVNTGVSNARLTSEQEN